MTLNSYKLALILVSAGTNALFLFGLSYFEFLIFTNGSLTLYRDAYSWFDLGATFVIGCLLFWWTYDYIIHIMTQPER